NIYQIRERRGRTPAIPDGALDSERLLFTRACPDQIALPQPSEPRIAQNLRHVLPVAAHAVDGKLGLERHGRGCIRSPCQLVAAKAVESVRDTVSVAERPGDG